MKPIQTLLLLISVFIVLYILSYFLPNGISLSEKIIIKLPRIDDILLPIEEEPRDISQLINLDELETASLDTLTIDSITPDSVDTYVSTDATNTKDSIAAENTKKIAQLFQRIEFPKDQNDLLYPFFNSLANDTKNELIRVLHYGDSQIEGDRITNYIRNELQKQFGGNGVGLFAPVLIKGTSISLNHNNKGSWYRYTFKSVENETIDHKRLGVLMSFGRFSPSSLSVIEKTHEGEINLKRSAISYSRARKIETCKVMYGFNKEPFMVELKYKDQILDADIIPPTNQLNTISWNIGGAIDQVSLNFYGEDSPDIYSISVDNSTGVAVDNIPMRGSSGTDFTRSDISFYRTMFQKLNVKLVIVQFGVNLVPYIIDDYSYYERQFYRQLRYFKSLNKDISILVIGVSDMSRKVDGRIETYPNVELIRNAQKNAAFKAGCAFWDCYEAMGGENSMPVWVNTNPPLAKTDYTHFTYKGSVAISKLLYKALMDNYKEFQQQNN